jgi:hypothetical protein
MFYKKIREKEDDIFKNKLELVATTKEIFKKNPVLALFPIVGAVFSIISFVLLIMVSKGSGIVVLALILWYLITNILIAFSNSATASLSKTALNGNKPNFSKGLKDAFGKLNLVINWGVFKTFVGTFMNILSELKFAKYFSYSGEIAWQFVSYFIIPIMVFENKNVKDSIEESQKLIKKNWGRNVSGDYKITFISFVPFVIVLLILIFSSVLKDEFVTYSLFVMNIFVLILGMFMNYTLRAIFFTVIYTNVKNKAKK